MHLFSTSVPCTTRWPQQRDPRILSDDDTKSRPAYPDIEILGDGIYTRNLYEEDSSAREEELREPEMHLQFYMSNGSILLFTCHIVPYVFLHATCISTKNVKRDKHKSSDLPHASSKKALLCKKFLDAFLGQDPISISYEDVDSRRKDEEIFLTDVR